ncbi:MAG: hypothetical protein IJ210_10305 [Clostridia bacterium]|nr:hypothetical protein [Clostridia bacterium]
MDQKSLNILMSKKLEMFKQLDKMSNVALLLNAGNRPRQKKIILPAAADTIGYRWVTDKTFTLYIVKLKINGEYWFDINSVNGIDYTTRDCTVIEIKRYTDGESIDKIDGEVKAYAPNNVSYFVGNRIKDQDTYFSKTLKTLYLSQCRAMNNIIRIYNIGNEDKAAPEVDITRYID